MLLLKLRIENSAVFHLGHASGKYFKALNIEVYYNVFLSFRTNEYDRMVVIFLRKMDATTEI